MELFEAIRNRRSICKVAPDPIDREVIEQLLESATWAPNHHYTEPWKFFVLTGDGRRPLGKVLAEISMETMEDLKEVEVQSILKKKEEKAFRAPVIIAVAAIPSTDPKVEYIEEIGAVNAAIQNLLLAAHALGLGAIWRTGKPCYHPRMKELFGLADKDEMLGFIYLGYPVDVQKPGKRVSFQEKTVWVNVDTSYQ
ncbi:nitroreductase family protein [Bacillus solimangrovi]|uniref:Putative NAD(P)H nitroreductase n=1 Tax=Bacillus solimangrovi TaxID=1305675 RepID=A0A1E5LCF9_9BACI|nr:nitroreductase [Bacillus solimangrovi]OEH91753.1 nitroreductase [Bacillus solimangrovi]